MEETGTFYAIEWSIVGLYVLAAVLAAFAGTNKKIGFTATLILSLILTPMVGLFLALNSGLVNPPGCPNCGNKLNEAEICNLCGYKVDDEVETIGSEELGS